MPNLKLSPGVRAFWAEFETVAGSDASSRFYESFHFGDSELLADELAALVLAGAKRATDGPEFAALEGEGDGSLESWRRGHRAYFGRECTRLRKQPSASMRVVCERFEVIYRPRS